MVRCAPLRSDALALLGDIGTLGRDMSRIWQFLHDESGPTVVEYAVMLACIIAVCIASITLVGGGTYNFWNNNKTQIESAFSSGS